MLTAKSTNDLANTTKQALLQVQHDFRKNTESFAERMKHKFEEALSATHISATHQQVHVTFFCKIFQST